MKVYIWLTGRYLCWTSYMKNNRHCLTLKMPGCQRRRNSSSFLPEKLTFWINQIVIKQQNGLCIITHSTTYRGSEGGLLNLKIFLMNCRWFKVAYNRTLNLVVLVSFLVVFE